MAIALKLATVHYLAKKSPSRSQGKTIRVHLLFPIPVTDEALREI
ncbi:hypothetical protein SPLC1_S207210 [Arthrospira platensis C1]|nr:hypothetical protein SPLC1_S207210 [Arthrospira platensis C1]